MSTEPFSTVEHWNKTTPHTECVCRKIELVVDGQPQWLKRCTGCRIVAWPVSVMHMVYYHATHDPNEYPKPDVKWAKRFLAKNYKNGDISEKQYITILELCGWPVPKELQQPLYQQLSFEL